MKVVLAFVAIVGLAAADDLTDIKAILACFDKAMTDGVPSVGIPPYDPLQMEDVFERGGTYVVSIGYTLTNQVFHGLMNYTLPVLEVNETTSNPDTVTYHYAIHWPRLNYLGNWSYEFDTIFGDERDRGTFNIVLENLTWSGIFNLTKPGQEGYNETVNAFTVSSSLEHVEVGFTSLAGDPDDLQGLIYAVFSTLLNDLPESYADDLRKSLFNEFWIGHPEKVRAVMDYCGLSN